MNITLQAITSFKFLFGTALVAVLMPVSLLTLAGHTSAETLPVSQGNTGSGQQLYDDVKHYESFGVHRYGPPGADQAMGWIAGRRRDAGLSVQAQRFTMQRQYSSMPRHGARAIRPCRSCRNGGSRLRRPASS